MERFGIVHVTAGGGRLGLCPMPGRCGDFAADLDTILGWGPALVLTMATEPELRQHGALALPAILARHGIGWQHLPLADYAADSPALRSGWAAASRGARDLLGDGRAVLAHCLGGCGRSGMAVMRLMVELGEPPDDALTRLRTVRPCAVETDDQRNWASAGGSGQTGSA